MDVTFLQLNKIETNFGSQLVLPIPFQKQEIGSIGG